MKSGSKTKKNKPDQVPLDLIRVNDKVQSRVGLDNATVEEYTIAMQNGAKFPPVDVFYDDFNPDLLLLADGFHRFRAAQRAGIPMIDAIIHHGSERDAILHSVGANSTHGLRRSNADKRHVILTLLKDKEWCRWSDRAISRRAGVDHKTVSKTRLELSGENPQIEERKVSRNGVIYTQKQKTAKPSQQSKRNKPLVAPIESSAVDDDQGHIEDKDLADTSPDTSPDEVSAAAVKVGAYHTEPDIRSEVKHKLAEQISLSPPPFPTDQFDVIVIDPPWKYDFRENDRTHRGRVNYPDMPLEEIMALPVSVLTKDDGILWLWTTNSFMGDAFKCLETWGFTHKTILTWVKTTKDGSARMGVGNWLRNATEHCLLAVKGKPASPSRSGLLKSQTTVLQAPRREHSRKPDEFYSIVESLCPGSKLEMFARSGRPGWTGWGAELNLFDVETDTESLELPTPPITDDIDEDDLEPSPWQEWTDAADDTEFETINRGIQEAAPEVVEVESTTTINKDNPPNTTTTAKTSISLADESEAPPVSNRELTREQLGELLGKSREAIRLWEKEGSLGARNWEPVPGTGTHPKNPKRYREI